MPTNLFFFLLLFAFAAYGQQQERVAIIQTVDNRDSIGFDELTHLTDRLRETAVNILPKQRYGVMTTESIVAFLGSQEDAMKICKEASCLADLGRKVSADYVAQARIGRFGEKLTIKTELYNSKSGNLISSFTGSSKDIDDLLDIIDKKTPDLFKKLDKREDRAIEDNKPYYSTQVNKTTDNNSYYNCPNGSYKNSQGNTVCNPSANNAGRATAVCRDGTYSYSQSRRGTCSGHGGVARWL